MANKVDHYLTILGGKRNVKRVLNYLKGDDGKRILEKIRKDYRAAAEDLEFLYVDNFTPIFSPFHSDDDDTVYHFQVKDNTIYFYTPMDTPGKVVRYLSSLFPSIVFKFEVYDRFNPEEDGYVKYLAGQQIEYKNVFWRHVNAERLKHVAEYEQESLYSELFGKDFPSDNNNADSTVNNSSEMDLEDFSKYKADDLPF